MGTFHEGIAPQVSRTVVLASSVWGTSRRPMYCMHSVAALTDPFASRWSSDGAISLAPCGRSHGYDEAWALGPGPLITKYTSERPRKQVLLVWAMDIE